MADFCRLALLTITLLLVSGDAILADEYSAADIDKSNEVPLQHIDNITLDIQKWMHKSLDEVTVISRLLDRKQHHTQMNVQQERHRRQKLNQMKGTWRRQLPHSTLHSGKYTAC